MNEEARHDMSSIYSHYISNYDDVELFEKLDNGSFGTGTVG